MVIAKAAQAGDERFDGARVETKLGHDLDRQSGRLGGGYFFRKRAFEFFVADARMALRISGNANSRDAAPAQYAGVYGVKRAPKRTAFVAIAGNNQNRVDAGFAVEPC